MRRGTSLGGKAEFRLADPRDAPELFGHGDVATTAIYNDVVNRGRGGFTSSADGVRKG